MEMNKDEAERCKNIAVEALRRGNYEKALRFFDKSLKLFPLPGVERLKSRVLAEIARADDSEASQSSQAPPSQSRAGVHRRTHASSRSQASEESESDARAYTAVQLEMVRRVTAAGHDHYKVLGVERGADENEIKRAYKKLALKVHPDKNSAPGAENAFKAVGKAFAVLGDGDKRAHFDRYGNDEAPVPQARGGHPFRGHPNEMTPEEIFNMFFEGVLIHSAPSTRGLGMGNAGFRQQRAHHHRHAHQQQQQQEDDGMRSIGSLLNLLPLLIIILFFFASQGKDEMPFSLSKSQAYRVERHTQRWTYVAPDIPYYVKEDFQRQYGHSRSKIRAVEERVQQNYEYKLAHECNYQNQERRRLIYSARSQSTKEAQEFAMERVYNYKMPACDELERVRGHR